MRDMISNCSAMCVPCDAVFVIILFNRMYNKTNITFSFGDILKYQGLSKCYQPWHLARRLADNTY